MAEAGALTKAVGDALSAGLGRAHARLTLTALAVIAAGPVYLALARGDLRAVSWSLATSVLVGASLVWHRVTRSEWARGWTVAWMSAGLGAHYFSTQRVTALLRTPLRDAELLALDSTLLGWAFPHGQVSLTLDVSGTVGPDTVLGRLIADVLTLCYLSYYIWPYVLLILHLGHVALCRWKGDGRGAHDAWARAEMTAAAWVSCYMATFALNALCPAVSPRLYLRESYTRPLSGLAAVLSPLTNHDNTYGSFPSGHVGETAVVGFAALIAPPFLVPWYGAFVTAIAAAVALATVWLRYHYVIDVAAAVPVVVLALAWGLLLPRHRALAARSEAVRMAAIKNPPRKSLLLPV